MKVLTSSEMKQNCSSLLIIASSSPESHSPAGERLRHLALASGMKFNQVVILALRGAQESKKQEEKESRVTIYTINFARAVPYPFSIIFDPVKMLMFLAHGLILCGRIHPSHILASMPPLETGVSAWVLAKLKRITLLVDLRDDWESAAGEQLKRYFPKASVTILLLIAVKIYSSASAILAVTQTIAETVQRRSMKTRVLLVPNGANTDIFVQFEQKIRKRVRQEYGLPLDKNIVVYCGSGINPYYRLDLALSSVKILSKESTRKLFFVFYVYNGIEHLKEFQDKLAVPTSLLEIRNPLPREQLAKVLAACDVGLVPFDAKSYLMCARSTKIYEYLSSGLYVACSGPRGGELDVLLSANDELGMFVLPTIDNFVKVFEFMADNVQDFSNEDLRASRHLFIRENYDRQIVMQKAINTIFKACNRQST